jgi:hypothetical protein
MRNQQSARISRGQEKSILFGVLFENRGWEKTNY